MIEYTVSAGGKDGYCMAERKAGGDTRPPTTMGNLWHKLVDILVIGLATLLGNRSDFEDMEMFGGERETEFRKFLELPRGIPDESTFFRVLQRIKPALLSACLYA